LWRVLPKEYAARVHDRITAYPHVNAFHGILGATLELLPCTVWFVVLVA
jgi:hypothetical protein